MMTQQKKKLKIIKVNNKGYGDLVGKRIRYKTDDQNVLSYFEPVEVSGDE
jgi:hypothetical protein